MYLAFFVEIIFAPAVVLTGHSVHPILFATSLFHQLPKAKISIQVKKIAGMAFKSTSVIQFFLWFIRK